MPRSNAPEFIPTSRGPKAIRIMVLFLRGADLHVIAKRNRMTMEQIAGHLRHAKHRLIDMNPNLEYARRAKWGAIRMTRAWRLAFLRAAERMAA